MKIGEIAHIQLIHELKTSSPCSWLRLPPGKWIRVVLIGKDSYRVIVKDSQPKFTFELTMTMNGANLGGYVNLTEAKWHDAD